ncbi:MAG TPA: hypothetical protein VGC58_03030 [Candidatus Paceibacterota bacterium]
MKKAIIFALAFLFLFSNTVYAEVTQFIFKTDPQTVEAGVQSKTITIQSQNSSGL